MTLKSKAGAYMNRSDATFQKGALPGSPGLTGFTYSSRASFPIGLRDSAAADVAALADPRVKTLTAAIKLNTTALHLLNPLLYPMLTILLFILLHSISHSSKEPLPPFAHKFFLFAHGNSKGMMRDAG